MTGGGGETETNGDKVESSVGFGGYNTEQDLRSPLMASPSNDNGDSSNESGKSLLPSSARTYYDAPLPVGSLSKIDQIVKRNSGTSLQVPSRNNIRTRPDQQRQIYSRQTRQISTGSSDEQRRSENQQGLGLYRFIIFLTLVGVAELYVSHYLYTFHHSYNTAVDDSLSFAQGEGPALLFQAESHVKDHLDNFAQTKKERSGRQSAASLNTDSNKNLEDDEKSKLVGLLRSAGIESTPELISKLPPYRDIINLYGDEPIIYGLETCETYRSIVPAKTRSIAPAGMFNSGTNFLYSLLVDNCHILGTEGRGALKKIDITWQVPWGKHTPSSWRWRNFPQHWKDLNHTHALPLVVIKDPYTWMGSMCRKSYSANWPHSDEHCPNLIRTELDKVKNTDKKMGENIQVNVRYNNTHVTHHTNLAGLWNDWYGAYFNVSEYPRLILRYEDLLFRPESTIMKICDCAGGTRKSPPSAFKFVHQSAKGSKGPHSGSSDLSGALLRYSNATERIKTWSRPDLEVASMQLHPDLMHTFGYTIVDP